MRRLKKGERGIWHRRFGEHAIRDEGDYECHVDYLHYNPVKHGYVTRVEDWPYSSFRRYVERGIYNLEWAADDNVRSLDDGMMQKAGCALLSRPTALRP